jgi:hypothetical protein
MIYKNPIMAAIFLSLFASCQNRKPADTSLRKKLAPKPALEKTIDTQKKQESAKDSLGPEITSFMEENNYVIQYQAEGFLNQDTFKDKVLILREDEQSNSLARFTLVLLGKKQGYEVYKESYTVMPAEYTADNYKLFDVEDVQIQNHAIAFDFSSAGPSGNIAYEFIFQNGELKLHGFTGYFMGAGSHTEYSYKPNGAADGVLEQTVINTMQDDMASNAKSYPIKLQSPADFETFDHGKFLAQIIRQPQ